MLNKVDKRKMAFSQEIVRIDEDDTVFWKATDSGHNVEFISKNGVPEGVKNLNLKLGKIHNLLLPFRVFMLTGVLLIKLWV